MPDSSAPLPAQKPKAHPPDDAKHPYISRSVSKAFEILGVLSTASGPISVSEVAEQADLTRSFAFRLLRTLESLHQVGRSADGGFTLARGSHVASSLLVTQLLAVAREPMSELNYAFQETVSLAALFANRVEVIEVFNSPSLMKMSNVVGRIVPPHASSLGKVITAFLSASDQQRLIVNYGLQRITAATITDKELLTREFEQIRACGYAYDREESILGAHCVGAPIYMRPSRVVAAVSLSMPLSRLPDSPAGRDRIVQAAKDTAAKISGRLQTEGRTTWR